MEELPNGICSLAVVHYKWLEKMGWNKTNPLESLALITSEIGEAVNECRGRKPTAKFGEELADIVLRVFGVAEQNNICIRTEIHKKMKKNLKRKSNRGRLK